MNFFEQQDRARRRTTWLVLLFVLAIGCVTLSFYGLALFAIVPQAQDRGAKGMDVWWDTELFLQITGAVCLIIFLGAGVQRLRLGGSGKSVAEALGGRLMQGSTSDGDERVLRDVVDEMAIASGMPVPPIFILQEEGINAFAAGSGPQDAVLGFTRGAISQLSRDELQGVTGHEFSHIAHRDTRLNLRIACVVAGVMLIALIGRVMLQIAGRMSSSTRGFSKKNNSGNAVLFLFAAGLGLLVVGGIGAFFGRLLQAAVSRQREFLADASAVQYSRNPRGIAGALRRIGSLPFTPIQSPAASGLNHFFFSRSIHSWLSTHPPLPERVRRIEQGGFIGEVVAVGGTSGAAGQSSSDPGTDHSGEQAGLGAGTELATGLVSGNTKQPILENESGGEHIPEPRQKRNATPPAGAHPSTRAEVIRSTMSKPVTDESLDRARGLLGQIPEIVHVATREPLDAQAVLLLLVTGVGVSTRQQVRAIALENLGVDLASCWDRLAPHMPGMPDEIRLIVLDLCVPTLTHLTKQQYVSFRATLTEAMRSDTQIDLFEWMTRIVLSRRIETRFGIPSKGKKPRSMRECSQELRMVLATLAHAGSSTQTARVFDLGTAECGLTGLSLPGATECTLDVLNSSLEGLDGLSARDRKLLANALVAVAAADNTCNTQELLLLRAFAYRLDIHLPIL